MNRLLSLTLLILFLATQLTFPLKATAASNTLSYTALGDSLAVGIADFSGGGYVPRYATYAQADTGSSVILQNPLDSNLSAPGRHNGWTSSQLLDALRNDAVLRNLMANSQVITWDIGGNDFLRALNTYSDGTCGGPDNQDCFRSATATLKANWSAIIAEVLSLRSPGNTIIRTMDIYNPFVNVEKNTGTFTIIKGYLDDVNRYIATTSAANNIPCARVYEAFNGPNGDQDAAAKGYMSSYDPSGVHPSDLGHKVIAGLLRNLGYAPLLGPGSAGAPILLMEENSNRAAAVDSVTLVRDPFSVFTTHNFSADGRTRLTLFAANAALAANENASALTAQAEDSQHKLYPLAIEYAGKVPNFDSLTQVIVKLPDELASGGDVWVSISLRGVNSNKALITIK
ncbi:MAG TPA: GDSL-type esterase/lipase family protein [Pyrinomonadaceae bacterium]